MNYVWDVVIAIITGIISGYMVDYFVRKRDEKRVIYNMWMSFLMKTLEKHDIYIDYEKFDSMPKFKNKDKTFETAIFEIQDILYPLNHMDKEYDESEQKLFENITIAMKELGKWKKENKIWFKF